MSQKTINVHIGQAKKGSGDCTLSALLGSCVGIGLIWNERKMCTLAHCLLDVAPENEGRLNARYVNHAIPLMLKKMGATEDDYHEIKAVVAGGSNMTMPDVQDPENLVGTRNSKAAFVTLKRLKLRVAEDDIGGKLGRTISINCSTGDVKIKKIPRNEAA